MAETLEPLERLTDMFRKLDGVGKKSAARYAFCVLNFTEDEARDFAEAILAVRRRFTNARSAVILQPANSVPSVRPPHAITRPFVWWKTRAQ